MAWSVQDLAQVTDVLISNLTDEIKNSPRYLQQHFQFDVTGLMPAAARAEGGNTLSLYLLHVGRDPNWRNTPVQGKGGQVNTSQPLSLNLSYLLTAYSEKNWQMEQYLMSVALAYFHAHPLYISSSAEFTITVEADSIEEMSRLWQAITVPIRLSAMFRVAVIFLTPENPPSEEMRPPVEVSLSVGADLNAPISVPEPHLFEVAMQVAYRVSPDPNDPRITPLPKKPTGIAGETIRVRGSGLDGSDGVAVYLSPLGGGAEWPITGWRIMGTSASGTAGDGDELVLALPTIYGPLPAPGTAPLVTPPPGAYQITVGNTSTVTPFRSNALELLIAPEVNGIGPGAPLLTADGSKVYSFTAGGLIDMETSVFIDQTALAMGAVVAPGTATVDAVTGKVSLMLPTTGFASGSYVPVRVVVNAIEALPGWWIKVP